MTVQKLILQEKELKTLIFLYKTELLRKHSKITVKNYISDINYFLSWFLKRYGHNFSADLLSKNVIEDYIKEHNQTNDPAEKIISYRSFKRHLSSLRSFTQYLRSTGYLASNPFITAREENADEDEWSLRLFKDFLYRNKSSDLTIKHYINDIKSFKRWCSESAGIKNLQSFSQINPPLVSEYISRLKSDSGLSPLSINRKLSSLRRYIGFMKTQSLDFSHSPFEFNNVKRKEESVDIDELTINQKDFAFSTIPPIKLVQKMGNLYTRVEDKAAEIISSRVISSRLKKIITPSSKTLDLDKIISGFTDERIKKEFYAPYSISIANFPIYKKLLYHVKHTRPEWYKRYHTYPFVHYVHLGVLMIFAVGVSMFLYNETLGNAGAQNSGLEGRTFVFKGKLLDKNGTPVNNSKDIRLALYKNPTGEDSYPVWKETQTNIKPDSEGNVVIAVGSRTEIPNSLFQDNSPLYLGIAIGDDKELSPRQPIGVPFANSSKDVQGFIPITNSSRQTNVLLALDAGGVLTIGGSANPVFQATGGDFTLSGQTLILTTNPSSSGNVIINPDGNGKIDLVKPLISSGGRINVEGIFSIEATSSATPALLISQNSGGPLLTASTAGQTRFNIDSQGTITNGIWAGTPISTEFGGFGTSITAIGPGELLYSTSNTTYGHLYPGAAGECLVSNGRKAPLWSSCGFLTQLKGHITLTNNSLDLILGSDATSSAKFAFINMNSGNPTFKIGQSLSFSSNNLIEALDADLKIGGSSTKNLLLASSGNVGVGTTSPSRSLDINGNFGGNVDYYSDGSNTKTITRDTKALVYDLEKNTGRSETSTITTYDITGLPDIDGTIAYIYTKVSKDLTLSPRSQTLVLKINGAQLSSISTPNDTVPKETIKHYTAVRSNSIWHLMGSYGDSDRADIAEWIETNGEIPEVGSIVSISLNGKVEKSKFVHDPKVAGIVSTNPSIVIGPQTSNSIRLALSGRVPVIVTSLSGEIKEGNYIASSLLPGVGMKPDINSATVGKALESFSPNDTKCIELQSTDHINWPEDDGKNILKPCFRIKVENLDQKTSNTILSEYGLTKIDYIYIGKIIALANLSWSLSDDLLASIDSATISSDESFSTYSLDSDFSNTLSRLNDVNPIVKVGNKTVKSIAVFGGIIAGRIKAGSVIAKSVAVDNLIAAKGIIDNLTSQNITAKNSISSPLAKIDELKTDNISPLKGNKVTINIPQATDSALIVRNSDSNQEAARIDSEGNASFSGTLSSRGLASNDATISGTLRTNNLIADNISGLDEKVGTLAAQIISNSKPQDNFPASELSEYFSENSMSAKFGTFYEGLLSLGASTFGNLSIIDTLSIGTTLSFSQNSINTLGEDLSINPLRQGAVSFLAGALRIEADGRLTVSEDAEFKKNLAVKGKLYSNVLSPLPDSDLNVELSSKGGKDSAFVIKNSSGSAAFTVSSRGDLSASGSATVSKINFNLVEQAYALDLNTATASTSAGTAVLKANTYELTILNPLVTNNSLIYITPANNTNNNVMFLMRQNPENPQTEGTEGSFTIGVSQALSKDSLFNWLIVN
jgi:site-specific recombinase XerD